MATKNFLSTKKVYEIIDNYSDLEKHVYATFRENNSSIREAITSTEKTVNFMKQLIN